MILLRINYLCTRKYFFPTNLGQDTTFHPPGIFPGGKNPASFGPLTPRFPHPRANDKRDPRPRSRVLVFYACFTLCFSTVICRVTVFKKNPKVSVVSNWIRMKFGRIVLWLNTHWLTQLDFWLYFQDVGHDVRWVRSLLNTDSKSILRKLVKSVPLDVRF